MKTVTWTDANGMKHRSVLQDDMPETRPKDGYLADPPDIVHGLNWEKLKVSLYNELFDRGLFTYQDVIASQNGLSASILRIFRKVVKDFYRQQEAT